MKIGILGGNPTALAVAYGFTSPTNQITTNDDLWDVDCLIDSEALFICADLAPYRVLGICDYLAHNTNFSGLVIIKTPLPPGELSFSKWVDVRSKLRIAINPDLLTDNQPNRQFVESPMIIVGTDNATTLAEFKAVYECSNLTKRWYILEMTFDEASLAKICIETVLASKLAIMGELAQVVAKYTDRPWEEFADMMAYDTRVGRSHIVPIDNQPITSVLTMLRAALTNRIQTPTISGAITSLQLNQK